MYFKYMKFHQQSLQSILFCNNNRWLITLLRNTPKLPSNIHFFGSRISPLNHSTGKTCHQQSPNFVTYNSTMIFTITSIELKLVITLSLSVIAIPETPQSPMYLKHDKTLVSFSKLPTTSSGMRPTSVNGRWSCVPVKICL